MEYFRNDKNYGAIYNHNLLLDIYKVIIFYGYIQNKTGLQILFLNLLRF